MGALAAAMTSAGTFAFAGNEAPPSAGSGGSTVFSSTKAIKAERKATRRAARKAARAKKNAEIKRLEQSGYKPGGNNPDYPRDLEKAQGKAGVEQGASQ
ncbi:hypothetical protein [Trinickia symbiotica]|nr:hypothetical protein [Trinickia symbiotica]